MSDETTDAEVHRATYTLQRGTWQATCKVCGHRVQDPVRRRAAATFRQHISATSAPRRKVVIDLTASVEPAVESL